MVIAIAALIAALAGTAVAVDKITSGDIAKNAVRSKHIKQGQVKAADTDITRSRFASNPRTGGDVTPVSDLNITVQVKRGDAVSIQGFGLGSGHNMDGCDFYLDVEGAGIPSFSRRVMRFTAADQRKYIDKSSLGTADILAADPIDLLVPGNGRLEIRPMLAQAGPGPCSIRDRGLSVTVHR